MGSWSRSSLLPALRIMELSSEVWAPYPIATLLAPYAPLCVPTTVLKVPFAVVNDPTAVLCNCKAVAWRPKEVLESPADVVSIPTARAPKNDALALAPIAVAQWFVADAR